MLDFPASPTEGQTFGTGGDVGLFTMKSGRWRRPHSAWTKIAHVSGASGSQIEIPLPAGFNSFKLLLNGYGADVAVGVAFRFKIGGTLIVANYNASIIYGGADAAGAFKTSDLTDKTYIPLSAIANAANPQNICFGEIDIDPGGVGCHPSIISRLSTHLAAQGQYYNLATGYCNATGLVDAVVMSGGTTVTISNYILLGTR